MRTQQEILERIKEVQKDDFLGTETSDLINALEFENVKVFLNDGVTQEEWEKCQYKNTKQILDVMLDYIPFAWEKANNERGLSAGRSMSHFAAWVWLMGDDLGDLKTYSNYGKENLRRICKHYGWDFSRWDED